LSDRNIQTRTFTKMQFLILLASLFAAVHAQSSRIGAPAPGSVLQAGQDITIQFVVPIDTSPAAGQQEVSLVIGMVACPSGCPTPSADLGEVLFVGKYESQGGVGNTLNSFENITVTVPSDISGPASIQIQHNFLSTPPQHAHSIVELESVAVQID